MRTHIRSRVVVLSLAVVVALPCWARAEAPDFDKQVAPILASRCLECHGSVDPKGKLDLSQAKTALLGGESGPALVRERPDESYLWHRVQAGEMPPKHPLPADERAILKAWISAGAKWGTDPIDPFRFTTKHRAGYDWWSLQPLTRPRPPAVKDAAWPKNALDQFVLAQLEAQNLEPSPAAVPRTLVRRLYFDVIGLPPSPEELEESAPYAAIVDRLLASPHYGERWARHWLDVAHYGESDGFEFDRMRPHAWRYRDWVIEAFNRDLPYDQFAQLQIAGDVLRPGDEASLIATGFLVGGAHDSLMPKGQAMQMIMRQDELEDVVALVSQSFLGLTVNCARCHDHKFDPVKQTDYYRLAAALAGVKRGNLDLPSKEPANLLAEQKRVATEQEKLLHPARTAVLAKRKASSEKPPKPIAQWDFHQNLEDKFGALPGTAQGGAVVDNAGLLLNGKSSYVVTAPLARDLSEKTLEAWVQLESRNQRGAGVISVESLDGKAFDAIVFGEKEPNRWIAGSDNFKRTVSIEGASDETEAFLRFIHLAAVYHADGQIQLYRDGLPYGKAYTSSGPIKFEAGKSHVVFGLRHSPAGGNKLLDGRMAKARLYDRALSAEQIAASSATRLIHVDEQEILAELDEAARAQYSTLKAESLRVHAELQTYRDRKAFAVTPQTAPVVNVLIRGNVQQPGEVVTPAGIACLHSSQAEFELTPDAPDALRRTKLAEWIGSEHNPLFARTIVNRVWQYHFGRGLVETPNDLGFSGGYPSHPELLDWLASELIASNWSLKHLHRLILTSATYQQASRPRAEYLAIDADNRLLWRYVPRRLDAECVRDAMLAASMQLNPQIGGPSYMDFRPFLYKNAQYYEPIDPVGPDFHRRTIYRFWARGGRNPLLDTFDCPDPSTAAPQRASTTTPLQALSLLNNSFTLRAAEQLAERLERESPSEVPKQIQLGFKIAYGRPATAAELEKSQDFVNEYGLPFFCRVLLNSNGFLYVD